MDTPSYHHSLDEHLNAIKRYSRSPPIFSRDFAYADSSPVILSLFEESRMAGENISDFSAASFAEYVCLPFSFISNVLFPRHAHAIAYLGPTKVKYS